jgi:hypothetical protein
MKNIYQTIEDIKYTIADLEHQLSESELDSKKYNYIQNQLTVNDEKLSRYYERLGNLDIKSVVKDALEHSYFLESRNIYYTSYFLENVISSSDLDEFTKLVRKSAIKYLELLKSETA